MENYIWLTKSLAPILALTALIACDDTPQTQPELADTSPYPAQLLPGSSGAILITDIASGGSGCPQGSVQAMLAPEQDHLDFMIRGYKAMSNEQGGTRVRKSCSVGIAVQVPPTLRVALTSAEYFGQVQVPLQGAVHLNASYFLAGTTTDARFQHTWTATEQPRNERFAFVDDLTDGALVWSACGESAILRANTSIRASASDAVQPSMVEVVGPTNEAAIRFRFHWQTCNP